MGVLMASNKLILVYGLVALVFFRLVVVGAEATGELKKSGLDAQFGFLKLFHVLS